MPPVYFLQIDGISGESADPEHRGELELESFSWGESAAPGGATADLSFTARVSKASPALFDACAGGRRIPSAVLTIRDPAARTSGFQRWRFADVVVASYVISGRAEGPLEAVTFDAAQVEALPTPQRPALRLHLIRPDDLLNLELEAVNLRLDRDDPADPALVVDDPGRPARLVVRFPPQTIAETAFFESPKVEIEPDLTTETPIDPPPQDADKGRTQDDPVPLPGVVAVVPPVPDPPPDNVSRLGNPSRLVFEVEAETRIPFTIDGLLGWSALTPSVSPIAAIPPDRPDLIGAAPPIRPPEPGETALELPYRLVISPNREVSWLHRARPFSSRGRTELWHTRLALRSESGTIELSRDHTAPLRAIWSPDYNPDAPPPPSAVDPDLGLTAMAPNDRHQIVILTSAFHGYEYEAELDLDLPGPLLQQAEAFQMTGRRVMTRFRRAFPYVPTPFYADLLMLSPLGGWLRSRGHWTPPYRVPRHIRVRPDFSDLLALARPAALPPRDAPHLSVVAQDLESALIGLFERKEQLDLSEWVHVAAQGRDHYVRIVYEGELKPFRNRAALIKVTERKFVENGPIVGAYLKQRMYIVVREPVRTFTKDNRRMPFKHIRLTTRVTPDIAKPNYIKPPNPTTRSFWVEVATGSPPRSRFVFHGVGTDVAGNPLDFTIPMMFVSLSDVDSQLPIEEYNRSDTPEQLAARELHVPGQRLAFAEPDADPAKRNTELVTEALNFVLDPENEPLLLKADVRIPQVQELLGTDAVTTIRLHESYVQNDFDAGTEVFAEISKPDFDLLKTNPLNGMANDTLGVEFSSDKAGGFATPNLGVSTLTRALGPLAGAADDALTDTFNPSSFFGSGLARLFGTFDLAQLLPTSTLGQNAPKLRTTTSDIPNGRLVKTTLDWEPQVENLPRQNHPLDVVEFIKNYKGTSALKVHGVITKSVKLDGSAEEPTFEFTGVLNAFRVRVLKAVSVNFVSFGFAARNGEKPDVTVALDTDEPVQFEGDLEFIEKLREAIPPDLFGDGPSLDVSPTGIRAGFAIGLPPIAVGVFALKDVNLGAALTLPFVDGKPVFDFNASTREHPFLLSVAIFGGGGFFHLQLDAGGIKELEAALEFGATASIDIGVASGGVHMMAGIYFKLERKDPSNELEPTLSGYLRLGGSLSVLGLITVSVEFNLSFTYDDGTGKAYGRATLTVEVEVAFFSKSVELTVERGFGGQSGDPRFADTFTAPAVWSEYAKAFA